MKIEDVGRVCHEAGRAMSAKTELPPWARATETLREAVCASVKFVLANPYTTPAMAHDAWLADRVAEGWKLGEAFDEGKKTDPALRPFDQLSDFSRARAELIHAIARALATFTE